ncbi:MAG TPA: hypothetical protein VK995_03640 [Oceanipulchritudo sp.]|nr:hypothetical protein [Oceanipulchritudo sp.]
MKDWKRLTGMGLLLVTGTAPGWGLEVEGLEGSVLIDGRIRYEVASQTGLDDSHAITARLRLGYETAKYNGVSLLVEGEGTLPLDKDTYDPYPGGQGTAGKAVIADPESLELNRVQVDWRNEQVNVTLGRQRIIRNNARFIGNVGWRQNEQTYDAVTAGYQPMEGVSLFYGYLDKAIRIFGSKANNPVQRKFDMESHAMEAQWAPKKGLKTGAYGYLLGIKNNPADSSDTFGAWVAGDTAMGSSGDYSFSWHAELANQHDNSHSPAGSDFSLSYLHLTAGLKKNALGSVSLGYEFLEGDGSRGFSTPLATLHAFNGFADVFLSTPSTGLRDTYLKVSAPLGSDWTATALWHDFRGDYNSIRYGEEVDLVLAWKINQNLSATGKAAFYNGARAAPGSASANITKIWIQLDAKY